MKKLIFMLMIPALCIGIYASQKYRVSEIIDGDTIKIDFNGKKEKVRLIGINTLESVLNDKARKEAEKQKRDINRILNEGRRSADFVKSVLKPGDLVALEFDVQKRDRYGRLLGYVYLPDGRMLNELIVAEGYASLMTIYPNVKYRERLKKGYRDARKGRKGLFRNNR